MPCRKLSSCNHPGPQLAALTNGRLHGRRVVRAAEKKMLCWRNARGNARIRQPKKRSRLRREAGENACRIIPPRDAHRIRKSNRNLELCSRRLRCRYLRAGQHGYDIVSNAPHHLIARCCLVLRRRDCAAKACQSG